MKIEKWLLVLDWLVGFALLGLAYFIDDDGFMRSMLVVILVSIIGPCFFRLKSRRLSADPEDYRGQDSFRQSLYLAIDFLIRFSFLLLLPIFFFFSKWFDGYSYSLLFLYLTYWNLARKGRHEAGRWK
ncbi:hypothetical protein JEQ21_01625 [Streptococcus sp. 121]|uniref:hypothetical protein n=1 Tax=Streptococcus sp. 121 TaxID=2797637 RepID=UPI0018F0B2E5|nr:hypothetical protein [Streptococcus sp. 121]MBJ6745170.1 hypothetical protein [Streptococcus sp. 121]